MTTFVLVPGACHGGWWYQPLADRLAESGHVARPVTLAGLEDAGTPDGVNLDTHIEQATSVVTGLPEGPGVVLVRHSYAGTVITAVADRVPGRVRALVYLDAFVPGDGDSCYAMTNDEQRDWYIAGAGQTGFGVAPLPFFDARARPHPLATLVQRVRLTGAWRSVPVKHYVAATGWPDRSPFADTTERLVGDPAWTVHHWPTTHNVLGDGPDRVFSLIADL